MPGRSEPIADFIDKAEEEGVTAIVALTPREEVARKSLEHGNALKHGNRKLPEVIESPVPDYGVPKEESPGGFYQALYKARTVLRSGGNGASVSTKNALGTFNWTNPNRSSATRSPSEAVG